MNNQINAELLSQAVEKAHNAIAIISTDRKIEWVNRAFVEMTGFSREEVIGEKNSEIFNKLSVKDSDKLLLPEQPVQDTPKAVTQEVYCNRKDGSSFWAEISLSPIINDQGKVTRYVAIGTEITDKKHLLSKLRQHVEQNKKILDSLNEGYILVDDQANIHDVNPAYCKMVGYSKEELLSMKLTEVRPDMSLEYQKEFIKDVVKKGSKTFETRHRRKDGRMIDLKASAAAIKREDSIYLAGFVHDITEQKKTLQKLHESEQRFKSLFEQNPSAVFSFDREGNFLMANKALEELTGYTAEELAQVDFKPLTPSQERKSTWKKFIKAIRGKSQTYETIGLHKNGDRIYAIVNILPIYVNGKIVGVFGVVQDITRQKEVARKLKESEERWQRLVENNPECVLITRSSVIQFINRAGAELFGYSYPEEMIGRSTLEFIHPDFKEILKDRISRVQKNESLPPIEYKFIKADKSEGYLEVHSVPVTYMGQEAIQTVAHDITELKEREKQIKQSLKEKEVLLKEIHHRVKNNMAVISGLLDLQAINTKNEVLQGLLKESQLRIYSMAMIHEKLYQTETLSEINFDEYIIELVRSIKDTVDTSTQNIRVDFDMEHIKLSINQAIPAALILNEVVVNCFKHAFNHEKNGTIRISVGQEAERITLSIEDDGVGLPEDFSVGDRKSLGMTLVATLSRQLGGKFSFVASGNNRGTRFSLAFDQE